VCALSPFAESIFKRTYAITPDETWEQMSRRVAKAVALDHRQEEAFYEIIRDRIFVPGGRYLYSAGRPKFMNSNCYGFMVEDNRESWAQLLHDITLCLSTGGGLGVNYSRLRPFGSPIRTLGGVASGPISLMQMVNEVARHVMMGGARRSALWAGLQWDHQDVHRLIATKDWSDDFKEMKARNFEHPAPLDMTNISVIIDDAYLKRLSEGDQGTWALHYKIVEHMARTGEPAFRNQSRILADDPGAITGNACQESTLHHNDTCNLGSIVMPRIKDLDHLRQVTRLAVQFLYNGSLKATYPTESIGEIAKKNRRLGLGIMGLHEWMLLHGGRYEWTHELERWLDCWKHTSDVEAARYSAGKGALPVTSRAIAPTGTISIMAETTSGIEPIYCVAYKRRYLKANKHYFQYVIDPTAKRLMDLGIKPHTIEDTYSLSQDIERRLDVQARVQKYVDQAISNTINLPTWGSTGNNNPAQLAELIARYLPQLKGLTAYPDGARSGQPLTPVTLDEAVGQEGLVYEEDGERCLNGVCGL
jgi:ribonucleoside-diphosphate reductase alpha chain